MLVLYVLLVYVFGEQIPVLGTSEVRPINSLSPVAQEYCGEKKFVK